MPAESNRREAEEAEQPFLFVPHGESPSADWLARHPGWISFSATMVPRGEDDRSGEGQSARGWKPSYHSLSLNEQSSEKIPAMGLNGTAATEDVVGFQTARALGRDPTDAYRDMSGTFETPGELYKRSPFVSGHNLISGVPFGSDAKPQYRAMASDQQPMRGSGSEKGDDKYRKGEPISPSDQEYGSGTDVVLPDGSFLEDSQSPSGHMRAPIGDLTAVARAGRSARDQYKSMLLFPETAISATGYLLLTLGMNVGQGGDFDYQRRGNRLIGFRQFHQYWHVSNFNVGLFAQQGGLTVEEALKTAGLFARLFSNNVDPSLPYSLNPDVADYIRKGFAAGESGVFEGHPSADHK